MKKHSLLAMLLLAALSLSACASDDDVAGAEQTADQKNEKEAASHDYKNADEAREAAANAPIGPQVAILRDLAIIRDYGGQSPDPSELVAGARMKSVDGMCEYRDDGIDVAFNLNMVAARGPRLGGHHSSFPIFVAVVDPASNILNKEIMTAEFSFSGDERSANGSENIHVFIPLELKKHGMGPDYRVLTGFQMPEADVSGLNASSTR